MNQWGGSVAAAAVIGFIQICAGESFAQAAIVTSMVMVAFIALTDLKNKTP